MYSAVSGNVGIGVTNPETILEIESDEPYLTLHNITNETTFGGRESEIRLKGCGQELITHWESLNFAITDLVVMMRKPVLK